MTTESTLREALKNSIKVMADDFGSMVIFDGRVISQLPHDLKGTDANLIAAGMRDSFDAVARAALSPTANAEMVNAEMVPKWDDEARYLTDDRDQPDRHELKIMQGGNGDWYVSVLPEGDRLGPSVRLCTSGGASFAAPGLTVAIAQAYRAMLSATENNK